MENKRYNNLSKLSEEEVIDIFDRVRSGDEELRNQIIEANLPLVKSFITRNFYDTPYDIEDLIMVGIEALIKNTDRFDPTLGFKFSTYVCYSVKNSIINYIRKESKENRKILFSLDEQIDPNGEVDSNNYSLIANNTDTYQSFEIGHLNQIINDFFNTLPDRAKYVFISRFIYNKSLKSIANDIGLRSHTSAQYIIKRYLPKLKRMIIRNGLNDSGIFDKSLKFTKIK